MRWDICTTYKRSSSIQVSVESVCRKQPGGGGGRWPDGTNLNLNGRAVGIRSSASTLFSIENNRKLFSFKKWGEDQRRRKWAKVGDNCWRSTPRLGRGEVHTQRGFKHPDSPSETFNISLHVSSVRNVGWQSWPMMGWAKNYATGCYLLRTTASPAAWLSWININHLLLASLSSLLECS